MPPLYGDTAFLDGAKTVLATLIKDDADVAETKMDSDPVVNYFEYLAKAEGFHFKGGETEGEFRVLVRYAVLKRVRDLGGYVRRIGELIDRYWTRDDPVYADCLTKIFSSFEIWNGIEYYLMRDILLEDIRQSYFVDRTRMIHRYLTDINPACVALSSAELERKAETEIVSRLFLGPELEESDNYTPIDEPLLNRLLLIRLSGCYNNNRVSAEQMFNRDITTVLISEEDRIVYWVARKSDPRKKWFLTTQKFLYNRGYCPGIFDMGHYEEETGKEIIEETDTYVDDAIDLLLNRIINGEENIKLSFNK